MDSSDEIAEFHASGVCVHDAFIVML